MSKLTQKKLEAILKFHTDSALSASEKAKMRMQLGSFMEQNAVRTGRFEFLSKLSGRLFRLRTILASLTVVILFSGASLASAQTALPGDALYNLKLFVNEKVPMAFMTDEEQQDFVVTQMDHRLEEAEQLKNRGPLTPRQEEILQAKFDEYFVEIAKNENPLKIRKDLSTVLEQHQEVLPQFTVDSDSMDDGGNVDDTDHRPWKGRPFKNTNPMTLKEFFEATHKPMEELEQEQTDAEATETQEFEPTLQIDTGFEVDVTDVGTNDVPNIEGEDPNAGVSSEDAVGNNEAIEFEDSANLQVEGL